MTTDTRTRGALIAGTLLLSVVTVLLCLIPKPENDLFFELRIGSDILYHHKLPHADTYSWSNRGTRWDVPEWLTFVLFALAYRMGGFFGTWLVMAVLAVATAWAVWLPLARRLGIAWAWALSNLMLLALSPFLQERPYAFTYLLLALSLAILTRARESQPRLLLWLPPLCALWTNLHQGVVVLLCLLLASALGDALTVAWRRRHVAPPDLLAPDWQATLARQNEAIHNVVRRAWRTLGTAAVCTGAAMLSPYGWRVFRNVFITLRDRTLMANVTEWNPVTVVPPAQLQAFGLVSVLVFAAFAFSRKRSLADALALAGLFGEALLHARNISLFAVGGVVIAAPHFASCLQEMRRWRLASRRPSRRALSVALALAYTLIIALVCLVSLRRAVGTVEHTPEGVGEAVAQVPRYPADACAFLETEGFPPNLRLLNNFEIGGYLMWRLPSEPVFIDGRLDVYAGRTFDDNLVLAHGQRAAAWAALVNEYDFDCVLTTSGREARAFAADPQWQLVYIDTNSRQRCRILLRRRPRFASLIARCLRDHPNPPIMRGP